MENTADEIKRLEGCINVLISVIALPAIWSVHESSQIVSTLLDVLLGMLRLDFAYARLNDSMDGSPIEVVRLAQRRNLAAQPQEVGRALTHWLTGDPPNSPLVVPNPAGEGEVSIAPLRLGVQDEVGILIAGSRRTDFPTKIEMLLLRVAANQAAIGLQEARRVHEQRRAAEENRFQAGLLDAVDQAVIATNTNGVITYWNRGAQRLYGWSAREAIGRNVTEITFAQRSPCLAAEMLSRWQRGERWTGEFFVQHRDDRIFPVLVTASPIYNSQEVLIGVVEVSIDITERKRAQEALEQRVAERTEQLTAVDEELREEIIERQRSEQRLAIQYAITRVLAQSDTLADAIPHLLQAIGESMVWEWGALWNIDRDAGVLRCESIWHAPNLQAAEFDAISRETAGIPGQGLKGRVWQNAEPTWIADATKDPNFARAPIAARTGLHGAFAFPLLVRSDTVGVMEFFSRTVRQPDGEQLATLSAIGNQIGQFVERKRLETERKRAEEELRRSEAYLAEAQRLSHTGSWAWDVSSGELFWSQEHFRIFGLDPEKVKPSYPMLLQWIHPDDRSFVQQTFAKAVRERSDYKLDWRIICPDGMIKHIHSLAHPVFNESGDLTEYAGTIIDTTERRQAEEALQKVQAELAHVTHVLTLGELTASIAHEVNQPLTAVINNGNACLRWLARETPDLDAVRGALRDIIANGQRAGGVIAQIRAALKKAPEQAVPLEINQVIEEVVGLTHREVRSQGIRLRTALASDLPPVLGDRVQLQQVLLNLVMNGIEAMSTVMDRPRELLIRSGRGRSDSVLVAVQDSGIGLDPQTLERIFDAFFTTKPSGMGMGLAISRTIIKAHGGQLWAEPNSGHGATFQFILPKAGENQDD